MKLIDISTKKFPNTFTQVDDTDFDWLNQWKWHARTDGTNLYVIRNSPYIDGKRTAIRMHVIISNSPQGLTTDHINGDTLDNRRENLRVCSQAENCRNRGVAKNFKSLYKGVIQTKSGSFAARIRGNGRPVYLGTFKNEYLATIAYNMAADRYHGEFARLNVIPPLNKT